MSLLNVINGGVEELLENLEYAEHNPDELLSEVSEHVDAETVKRDVATLKRALLVWLEGGE